MAVPSGTVTFLFTDIEGSTRRWEADQVEMRAMLAAHDEVLRSTIEAQGGWLFKHTGDGVVAAFSSPHSAVIAAVAAQLSLELPVRMGIATGEAEQRGDDYFGPPLNRAARVMGVGHGGQILIANSTAALLEGINLVDLGEHQLRDLSGLHRLFQVKASGLREVFPPLRTLDLHMHNLPVQLTSFIGREAEIAEVLSLVEQHRLVTLVGPGGVGKTRLALQVAAELVPQRSDGAWLVELASLSSPELLPETVARTLGVTPFDDESVTHSLDSRLEGKDLVLLFDNCEHLIGEVATVADLLLRHHRGLSILATSREPLGIAGEHAWPVPSLPDEEGVRLFKARAQASDDLMAIESICRKLEGIPLAIELAAARARMLTPRQIEERLTDRFRLLTTGDRTASERQQTLRATVDWSYDLLDAREQGLLRRLSVFAGGFDLEAAEAVGAAPSDEAEIIDRLGSLVDKSLVLFNADTARYRQLETIRQYSAARLAEFDEVLPTKDRHLSHFLDVAARAYSGRVEAKDLWLERLELDHDNLRAALDWAGEHHRDDELALAGYLAWFWQLHSHYTEGRHRLSGALMDRDGMSEEVARALWGIGFLAGMVGDESASAPAEASLAMWRALGQEGEVALGLESQGWGAFFAGRPEEALTRFEECRTIRQRLGDPRLLNLAEIEVCQALVALGRVDEAEQRTRAALPIAVAHGDRKVIHYAHHFLGDCALIRGDVEEAERRYMVSLQAALELGDELETSFEVDAISMAVAGQGRHRKGLILHAAADEKLKNLGGDVSKVGFWMALRDRYLTSASLAASRRRPDRLP